MNKFIRAILILWIFVIIFSAHIPLASVFAQEPQEPTVLKYKPLTPLPGTVPAGQTETTLPFYLPGLIKLLVSVAGGLAVLMMIIGGVQYMSTDAIFDKKEGKKKIGAALGGLLLAILSWLILNTINPSLLQTGFIVPTTPIATTTSPTTQSPPVPHQVRLRWRPSYITGLASYIACSPPYPDKVQCDRQKNNWVGRYFGPPDEPLGWGCVPECTPFPPPPAPPDGTNPSVPGWYVKTIIYLVTNEHGYFPSMTQGQPIVQFLWSPVHGTLNACQITLGVMNRRNPVTPPSVRLCVEIR